MKPQIHILMRTHDRPILFARAVESIKAQTYKNWTLHISADTDSSEKYALQTGFEVLRVYPDPMPSLEFPAQLYMNELMDEVTDGWIIVIDDDDFFIKTNALEEIASHLKDTDTLYCWHMRDPDGIVTPGEAYFGKIEKGHIDITCFAVHASHKNDGQWVAEYTGDYTYIRGLADAMGKVEWIDNVFVQKGFRANGADEYVLLSADKPPIDFGGKTDVVYLLGKGSSWYNNEIRYSIRSVIKHFKDLRHIVVIGEHPAWMDGVMHIAMVDDHTVAKDVRMLRKILAACMDVWVSDRFILATDDVFLLSESDTKDFTGWHFGDIPDQPVMGREWERQCIATRKYLESRKLKFKNYDLAHAFQPMEKEAVLKAVRDVDPTGMTCANLILNSVKVKGKDARGFHELIREELSADEIRQRLEGKRSFNINDVSLNSGMKAYLAETFPDPSEIEKHELNGNPGKDYQQYLDRGRPFWYGVELIEQYSRNRALLRLLRAKGETPLTRKKLDMNLNIISRKWKI